MNSKETQIINLNENAKKIPTQTKEPPENGLLNLLVNIAIPILVLNKGSNILGSKVALIIALAFPLFYGLYDYQKRKKINFISLLGLLNILITGSLALMGIYGIWFAVKEAAFPALIGIFVAGSAYTTKPFIETLLLNPNAFNIEAIQQKIQESQKESEFKNLLKKSTLWLSGSFALSAALNFGLALRIFTDISAQLSPEEQTLIVNQQIAEMTSKSFIVIMIPSTIFLGLILFFLFKRIEQLTGLKLDQLLPEGKK